MNTLLIYDRSFQTFEFGRKCRQCGMMSYTVKGRCINRDCVQALGVSYTTTSSKHALLPQWSRSECFDRVLMPLRPSGMGPSTTRRRGTRGPRGKSGPLRSPTACVSIIVFVSIISTYFRYNLLCLLFVLLFYSVSLFVYILFF